MDVNQDTRDRIIAAANQLFEKGDRQNFPSVDAVRKLARVNMNDASSVMKEWRRLQIASVNNQATVSVPKRVQQMGQATLAALWSEAHDIASESLTAAQLAWEEEREAAEKSRIEMSAAFECHVADLETVQQCLSESEAKAAALADLAAQKDAELGGQLKQLNERAQTAEVRVKEIERRADDLNAELARVSQQNAELIQVMAEVVKGKQ